jgi:hypothetical protein
MLNASFIAPHVRQALRAAPAPKPFLSNTRRPQKMSNQPVILHHEYSLYVLQIMKPSTPYRCQALNLLIFLLTKYGHERKGDGAGNACQYARSLYSEPAREAAWRS